MLLIGEDNPRSGDPRHALHFHPPHCAGGRLARILGLRPADHLNLWRTDLCARRWNTADARARACELLEDTDPPWQVVVVLGAKVASACRYRHDFFTTAHAIVRVHGVEYDDEPGYVRQVGPGEFRAISLPHPSGRNRAWDDPRNWARAEMLLRACAPDVPWGMA